MRDFRKLAEHYTTCHPAGRYVTCSPVADDGGAAQSSHLASGGVSRESGEYRGLEAIAAPFAERLEDPPVRPVSRVFQAGTLAALRNFVRERAARAGFSAEVTEDLVLAVHELATTVSFTAAAGASWECGATVMR